MFICICFDQPNRRIRDPYMSGAVGGALSDGRDRSAARAAYRQRVSDTHPFGMCGGFLIPP